MVNADELDSGFQEKHSNGHSDFTSTCMANGKLVGASRIFRVVLLNIYGEHLEVRELTVCVMYITHNPIKMNYPCIYAHLLFYVHLAF